MWDRGLGAGISRVMAAGSDVELIDRPDGNQFIARIWRTAPKDEITNQKANEELISITQKENSTVPKSKTTTPKSMTQSFPKVGTNCHPPFYPNGRRTSKDELCRFKPRSNNIAESESRASSFYRLTILRVRVPSGVMIWRRKTPGEGIHRVTGVPWLTAFCIRRPSEE